VRIVREGITAGEVKGGLLAKVSERSKHNRKIKSLNIEGAELKARLEALVNKSIEIVSVPDIIGILDRQGFNYCSSSKLVKKAVDDVANAILSAIAYSEPARRFTLVERRVNGWCEKIDPLKKRD